MFPIFEEIFDRVVRFVLAFNIAYAFAAAALAAAGFPIPSTTSAIYDWAKHQPAGFGATSDTSALTNISTLNILSFISTFVVSLVLGLVQIAVSLQPLLGPLYAPALATAVVMQSIALFYIAVRVVMFIKSLISPLTVYT
jgi:hypothetical protein